MSAEAQASFNRIMSLEPGIAAALCDIVGSHNVILAPNMRRGDVTELTGGAPDAVVYPRSSSEVAEILRGASACGIAVEMAAMVLRDGGRGRIVVHLDRLDETSAADSVPFQERDR